MAKIVQRPLVQHLRQRDLARRLVPRLAFAVVQRKPAQQLDIGLALVLEVAEVLLGVRVPVDFEVHLRVVRLEFGHLLTQETIEPGAVAVPLGVRKMRQHFRDRETVAGRFPPRVFLRDLGHQAAENRGRRFQEVEARQFVGHATILR